MRLKTLKIVGFKSFADRVTIDFDAEVIGIVGPNGCGKSNIVDAFRWVMGEQSAKSMRGSKMHDVLFAGTQKRKSLNMAEVSVTLSDIQGELATEYEEVTITRRLYKSGESEYLINRQPVRLRDIHSLLLGSGMGKNAFSIFEQGKIDQIINLPPLQRRSIFDEAAGIGRFLERKKETIRKLSQVDENFNRIRDIHDEVERQTKTLKRQATLAKQYKEKKERLAALEMGVLITRLKRLGVEHKAAEFTKLKQELEHEQKQFELIEQKQLALKKEVGALEAHASVDREALFRAESSAKISAAECTRQQERLEELTKREQQLIEQIKELTARSAQFAKGEKGDLEGAMKLAQSDHLQSIKREGELKARLQKIEFLLQEQRRLAHVKLESEEKKGAVETCSVQIDALQVEIATFDDDLSKLNKELASFDDREAMQKITELKAKAKALEAMKERSVHRLYEQKAVQERAELLTSFIRPKRGQAEVVDGALHLYKQTLVARTREDYTFILEFAKSKKITGFSLICMDELEKKKGGLISSAQKNEVAEHFLGGVHVEITDEGDVIDALKVRHRYAVKGLVYKQQLEEIELAVKPLEKTLLHLRKEHSKLSTQIDGLTLSRKKLEQRRRQLEMELVAHNFGYQRALKELEGKEQIDQKALEKERVEVGREIESSQKQIGVLEIKRRKTQSAFQQMKVMEAKAEESAAQEKRFIDELDEVKSTVVLTKKALETRESSRLALSEKLEQLRLDSDVSSGKVIDVKKQRDEVELSYLKGRTALKELEKKVHSAELVVAEDTALKQELVHELQERYEMTLESALATDHWIEDLKEGEKELKSLRYAIEKSGSVNMTAIDEYQEQEQRFETLSAQLKDLSESKRDLEKIIIGLDGQSRKLFKETFAYVRANFQRNFETLFQGGSADLKFTESKDILEAGVEITAKPPGKQMRSISLLSGGEKCLTALALLFSIFEVKPAPFCILDEVDAPLDDSNVGRFTTMLKHYVEKTQFIVVTHNKKTMGVADILIGVSMEEKGVSRLLSLTFERKYADRHPERV